MSLSQWRQLSQVALSGSRSEGGGCPGSRSPWSLSGSDAASTHAHTHATHTLPLSLSVGNILDCRIINRRQQKAAPLSSSPTPVGPHHSRLPPHPFLLDTRSRLLSSHFSLPLLNLLVSAPRSLIMWLCLLSVYLHSDGDDAGCLRLSWRRGWVRRGRLMSSELLRLMKWDGCTFLRVRLTGSHEC